jgi:phospholipid-translocating ATPase
MKMIISSLGTFALYILSILFLRSYFDTSYINIEFVVKVLILTTVSWVPLHLVKIVAEAVDPPEHVKVALMFDDN